MDSDDVYMVLSLLSKDNLFSLINRIKDNRREGSNHI